MTSRPATRPSTRSIAERHVDWPMLSIGQYLIGPCVHGGWWIENREGEGMQVRTKTLTKALDAFWKENF